MTENEEKQAQLPKAPLEERNSFWQLLMLVSIIILTSGVFSKLAFILANKLYQIENASDIISNADLWLSNRSVLIFLQLIISLGTFIVPGILFMFLISYTPFKYIKANKLPSLLWIAATIPVVFTGTFAVDLLIRLTELIPFSSIDNALVKALLQAEEQSMKGYEAFLAFESLGGFLLIFILMAVMPAIGEELIFRGLIQNIFLKSYQNSHVAVGFSAFWFALVHAQLTNFFALMFMGIILGYLYYWTKNLWIPIIAHMFNNGLIVIISGTNKLGWTNYDIMNSDALPWYFSILGVIIFILLFLWYKKFITKNHSTAI